MPKRTTKVGPQGTRQEPRVIQFSRNALKELDSSLRWNDEQRKDEQRKDEQRKDEQRKDEQRKGRAKEGRAKE